MAVAFGNAITYGYTSSLVTSGAASFTAWVKITTDRNYYSALAGWHNGTLTYRAVETEVDGVTWKFWGKDATTVGPVATVGTWMGIGAVYDGSTTGTIYSCTEGSSITTATSSGFNATAPTSFVVAKTPDPDQWLVGSIAALKVWHAELSLGDITAELSQYQPIRTANLVRYHSFYTAPGNVDESGNGNDLTVGSSSTTTDASGPNIPDAGGIVASLKAPIKNFMSPGA